MKLYEIAADYQNFMEAVESGEIPIEAVSDTLESIQEMLEEKVDNIACLIKNLTADITAIKTEENNLAERRKVKENQIERLKTYLSETLQNNNIPKIETARNKISFRKSEPVDFENENDFIEWAIKNRDELLTYSAPKVNKTEIKKAIANGAELPGVSIKTKYNLQIK